MKHRPDADFSPIYGILVDVLVSTQELYEETKPDHLIDDTKALLTATSNNPASIRSSANIL